MAFLNLLVGLEGGRYAAGGDMLRSAANQIMLKQSHSSVTTVWMDEVVEEPKAAMARIATFVEVEVLGEPPGSRRVDQLAERLVADEAKSFLKAAKGSHVTSASDSNRTTAHERRAALIAGLMKDPLIDEAYAMWRGVFS